MTDLVKRLRAIAEDQLYAEGFYTQAETVSDAANRIEQLEAENASLKRLVTDLKEDLSG